MTDQPFDSLESSVHDVSDYRETVCPNHFASQRALSSFFILQNFTDPQWEPHQLKHVEKRVVDTEWSTCSGGALISILEFGKQGNI